MRKTLNRTDRRLLATIDLIEDDGTDWALKPFLPMVRRNHELELGVMILGHSFTIFITPQGMFDHLEECYNDVDNFIETMEKRVYRDSIALMDDGWLVD